MSSLKNIALARVFLRIALGFLLLLGNSVSPEAEAQDTGTFEKPPVFKASEILPPFLLKGPNFKVDEKVLNNGFRNRYMLRTADGYFKVIGDDMLRIRINEANALAKLREIKNSKEFAEGTKNAVKAPFNLAKGIITQPIDTLSEVGEGVGRFGSRVGEMITGKRGKTEDHASKELIGFSAVKRKIAYDLNVDVYSTNQKLQEELNSVAWASFSGGFVVRVGLTAGVPVLGMIHTGQGMRKILRDNAPEDLRKKNRKKLHAMGVDKGLTRDFLLNPNYSPRNETIIVYSLAAMKGTRHRAFFVLQANDAKSTDIAFHFQRVTQLMRSYHQKVKPVVKISIRNDLPLMPVLHTRDGTLVLPWIIDYAIWDKKMSERMARIKKHFPDEVEDGRVEIWVSGKLSPKTKTRLDFRGFKTVENAFAELSTWKGRSNTAAGKK